ncbi:MAG: ABC transporter ATP-binding protein [Butyrivibrio sp.]|nr:ABC transporter ATP-binding protein [Butyrivibrio sp.]
MLELKGIRKSYDRNVIFEDVNISFKEGTVTCFAGHNGCGKSTMLKVIGGLIPKDAGEIVSDRRMKFAYVPEKFPAVNMKGRAYLKHMAKIDGIYSEKEQDEIIGRFAEDFFLTEMLDKQMKDMSKGTLQKIGVIQALMCDPDVLLLDEPLSGQDADSQEVFIKKILDLKKKQKIILLSAHEKNLIEVLSDRIYTIEKGKVILCNEETKQEGSR